MHHSIIQGPFTAYDPVMANLGSQLDWIQNQLKQATGHSSEGFFFPVFLGQGLPVASASLELCRPGWPGTHRDPLPLPPKCWV